MFLFLFSILSWYFREKLASRRSAWIKAARRTEHGKNKFVVSEHTSVGGAHFVKVGCTGSMKPHNMAQELGKNVTLACGVTSRSPMENVQWKFRRNGSDSFNALTFNQNVLSDKTKYAFVSTYNLTLIRLTLADEGTYRCVVGTTDHDIYLTIVDLPSSIAISRGNQNNIGSLLNLTCVATNGRPPAPLRWVVDDVDYTVKAMKETNVSSNGYGNVTSNLILFHGNSLDNKLVQCFVSYDGWERAMNTSYIIQHNGTSRQFGRGLLMLLTLLMLSSLP